MTTIVKSNTVTIGQLWRSFTHIRRDTELLDMTRVHSYTSHSYTSLRDVVAGGSLPSASSNKQWNNQLSSSQSLPSIRHTVHMRNPLVEKAARAYLATASHTHQEHNATNGLSSSFSSFLKIVRFPFLTTHRGFFSLFGGASAWFKQMTIKI